MNLLSIRNVWSKRCASALTPICTGSTLRNTKVLSVTSECQQCWVVLKGNLIATKCKIRPEMILMGVPTEIRMWTKLNFGYMQTRQPHDRKLYKHFPYEDEDRVLYILAIYKNLSFKESSQNHVSFITDVNLMGSRTQRIIFYIWKI